MKRNCVQNVMVHIPDNMDLHALSDKINEFHLQVVERRLNSSNLTTDDKIAVIDKILDRALTATRRAMTSIYHLCRPR